MSHINYFVDEAGDTTLFGRHGKLMVDTDVVSRFFIVARLEVSDVEALEADIASLRAELLSDPCRPATICFGRCNAFTNAMKSVICTPCGRSLRVCSTWMHPCPRPKANRRMPGWSSMKNTR